jgi:competence protein ComEC
LAHRRAALAGQKDRGGDRRAGCCGTSGDVGGNVSIQRAFIMVAVMLVAVLFDRQALTLRAVAIATVIVLLLRAEALFGPGFQMSFAAITPSWRCSR